MPAPKRAFYPRHSIPEIKITLSSQKKVPGAQGIAIKH
jgi:hypothetical protein